MVRQMFLFDGQDLNREPGSPPLSLITRPTLWVGLSGYSDKGDDGGRDERIAEPTECVGKAPSRAMTAPPRRSAQFGDAGCAPSKGVTS